MAAAGHISLLLSPHPITNISADKCVLYTLTYTVYPLDDFAQHWYTHAQKHSKRLKRSDHRTIFTSIYSKILDHKDIADNQLILVPLIIHFVVILTMLSNYDTLYRIIQITEALSGRNDVTVFQ